MEQPIVVFADGAAKGNPGPGGWGTIVSCLPGRLAYYYDEEGARRMLLERAPANR